MPAVCFYFQVHQPYRLRRYTVFDADNRYYDEQRNRFILNRVGAKCYRPATDLLLKLTEQFGDAFRFAFSLTGTVLSQFREYQPELIENFQKLAETGCVEFLSETYHHSLAFLYSRDEFRQQVDMHDQLLLELFGQTPRVFRSTELTYDNEMAAYLAEWGRYHGILVEGVDALLDGRSTNHLYHPPGNQRIKLLLRNYRLSDDIAFRFSNRQWSDWPLTAEKFAQWVDESNNGAHAPGTAARTDDGRGADAKKTSTQASGGSTGAEAETAAPADVCNVFVDFETFGEHQWAETGIFKFLEAMPERMLTINGGRNRFLTPSECIEAFAPVAAYDVPEMISWADTERDLSAWRGNAMQSTALGELYKLEAKIKASGDAQLVEDWRQLTCSDHFYYMCTKYFADGAVHQYFNPYESPYDSYINFMNVLDNLRLRLESN